MDVQSRVDRNTGSATIHNLCMKVARLLAPRWGRAINELLLQDRRCQSAVDVKQFFALMRMEGERLAMNLNKITNGP